MEKNDVKQKVNEEEVLDHSIRLISGLSDDGKKEVITEKGYIARNELLDKFKQEMKEKYGTEYPSHIVVNNEMFRDAYGIDFTQYDSAGHAAMHYGFEWLKANYGLDAEQLRHWYSNVLVPRALQQLTEVYCLYVNDTNSLVGIYFALPELIYTLHEIEHLYGAKDKPLKLVSQDKDKIVYYCPHRDWNWVITCESCNSIPGY